MAEVLAIIGGIDVSARILLALADQVERYKQVSYRLFDLHLSLEACQITLESWLRKYDIQERRPEVYMHVLFGRLGWDVIQKALGRIKIIARIIRTEIDGVVAQATKYRPSYATRGHLDPRKEEELVRECISNISRHTTWMRLFKYVVFKRTDSLEIELEKLNRKLIELERLSEGHLEREHPDLFTNLKRVPGRRWILKIGDSQMDDVQRKVLGALAARKDAKLLHRANGQGNSTCSIGISLPQIHKRDFAFLLSLQGKGQEVLVSPIKFRDGTRRELLESSIPSAVPSLLRRNEQEIYLLPPSAPLSAGFRISIPPTNLLTHLEYREPLSTQFITTQDTIAQQLLYPQDQNAIAVGLVQGSFRLLGSQWLQFLDSKNVRWRRSAQGTYTSMMDAVPGVGSTTRTLDRIIDTGLARRDKMDLTKHTQMFRIGLLLTELALKIPVTYIDRDEATGKAKIIIREFSDEPMSAEEVASAVELRMNVLYGNIVFWCLQALMDKELMGEKEIESVFYSDVVSQAEKLEDVILDGRRRGSPSPGTPSPV